MFNSQNHMRAERLSRRMAAQLHRPTRLRAAVSKAAALPSTAACACRTPKKIAGNQPR